MKELADELRSVVGRTAQRLLVLSEAEAEAARLPGQWVRKEILGHLIDSAANNQQRFVRAQSVSPLVLPGYDQQAWVSVHRYREHRWSDLVELWSVLNLHLAVVIEGVPADRLQTPCIIGDHEASPLEWWIRDYLRHLKHHLEQIVP